MRELILTAVLIAAALAATFGIGAMLESAFKAGPEPGIGTPAGPTPPPGERRGRARHVA